MAKVVPLAPAEATDTPAVVGVIYLAAAEASGTVPMAKVVTLAIAEHVAARCCCCHLLLKNRYVSVLAVKSTAGDG